MLFRCHLFFHFLFLIFNLILCKETNFEDFSPEIQIENLGKIRGKLTSSFWSKRTIYSFQGIPYAIPPVGNLRFQAPRPVQPWTGTLNGTSLKRRCPQIFDDDSDTEIQTSTEPLEDCLYLNIYTPMISNGFKRIDKLYPVIFYIHGGSFRVGSAHTMTPNYLLENDIVLVTIQYRLGVLGFLSLDSDELPGNMGFLDMLMALEWVHNHIRYFNGDKNSVTLMGQSAGGAAVTFFMTSPLVRDDLFHRAIIQSGSGLCEWATENDRDLGRKFSKNIGCLQNLDLKNGKLLNNVTNCLKQMSLSQLFNIYIRGGYGDRICQAVAQSHGMKKFLTEFPTESFSRKAVKNIPVMIGVTKHEGSSFIEEVFASMRVEPRIENFTTFKIQDLAREFLEYTHMYNNSVVSHLVESEFFGAGNYESLRDVIPSMSDLAGMAVLKSCVFQTARILSSINNATYLYSFHVKGRFTKFFEYRYESLFPRGVSHSDDLIYLFWDSTKPLNERELGVARNMVDLWTHFATHGYPYSESVPNWSPMNNDSVGPYLRINYESGMRDNFLEEFTIATKEGVSVYFEENSANVHQSCFLSKLILFVPLIVINQYFG